jgi:hypothetical protein
MSFKAKKLMLVDKETGEIIEEEVMFIGKKPTRITDRGFIKVFIGFLEDLIEDEELGGASRLLLYMAKRMNYNDLRVAINLEEVLETLKVSKKTYFKWKKKLVEKGYILQINAYVFEIRPYTFIRGNMEKVDILKPVETKETKKRKKKKVV